MEKLYYINDEAEIVQTKYNFVFIPGIAEKYRGRTARGKVVIAIRDKNCLRNVMDVESLGYPLVNQVMYTLSGHDPTAKIVSEVLKILYKDDPVFHRYLATVYYSRFLAKEKGNSNTILDFIMTDISLRLGMSRNKMNSYLRGVSHMYTNGIEYYYSVSDKEDSKVTIPIGYDYEVLTNAKAWSGSIQRQ